MPFSFSVFLNFHGHVTQILQLYITPSKKVGNEKINNKFYNSRSAWLDSKLLFQKIGLTVHNLSVYKFRVFISCPLQDVRTSCKKTLIPKNRSDCT